MKPAADTTRGYVRPMRGWWMRDAFFLRYMLREATAVAVLAYAALLAVGVVRLSEGEAQWNAFMGALRAPSSMLLHAVLLAAMIVHARSWFEIMPKTMPMLFIRGQRVAASAITRAGFAAAIGASTLLLALAWWLK